jgi:hypothetical protein
MPLVNNRFMVYDLVKVWGISGLLIAGIFVVMAIHERSLRALTTALPIVGLVMLGLFGLCVLIMLIFFNNRYPMEFLLSSRGVVMVSKSQRGHWANRLAVVVGAMAGKPGVVGSGLLAMSREVEGMSWEDVQQVKVYPQVRVITLMDSWHVVARLYCTPQNFETVRDAVQVWAAQSARKREAKSRTAGPSPLPRLVVLSFLTIIAAIGVTAVPVDIPVLFPWALGIFGLLSIWFLPWSRFLGVFTLVVAAAVLGVFLTHALETRQSTREADFKKFAASRGMIVDQVPDWILRKHRRYTVFDQSDWLQTGIGGIGLLFFSWLGIRAASLRLRRSPGNTPP